MKVYIDVSNLMTVDFLSGIQRVVREIVYRMIRDKRMEVVLITNFRSNGPYTVIDNKKFVQYFVENKGNKRELNSFISIDIDDMTPGSVFFDLDASFHAKKKRSYLLPELKARGIRVVNYCYDIIPLLRPETVHDTTIRLWMEHFSAHMKFDDMIITSVNESVARLEDINERLGLPEKKIVYSWLGNDFIGSDEDVHEIRSIVRDVVNKGKYILMVGTVEPRKNHKVILDAFEKSLFDKGINLVIVGRIGWNVEEIRNRIEEHPLLDKQLFMMSGINDTELKTLYDNAMFMAFPSYMEGFGLPIVEALSHGTPVVSSNEAAIAEVLGEYGDTFDPDDPDGFIRIVEEYLEDTEKYKKLKEKVAGYTPVDWDTVADNIMDALLSLEPDQRMVDKDTHIKQMVMISARVDDLLSTLPYIEHFMPFIKELVLCCPDRMVDEVRSRYRGRLLIKYLTDDIVLNGEPLPEDHGERNTFLRFCIMKQDMLDDVFIMGDDDGRPLEVIHEDFYIRDGRYQAYYYYHGSHWWGAQGNPTSFDLLNTRYFDFSVEKGLPSYLFGSHMPQVIDKRVYNEIREVYPGIEHSAYCEWSLYFNYLLYKYPNMVDVRLYKTLNWPGGVFDWNLYKRPEKYAFENYYEQVYHAGLFKDIGDSFGPETTRDNVTKIFTKRKVEKRHQEGIQVYDDFSSGYRKSKRMEPVLCIDGRNNAIAVYASKNIRMLESDNLRLYVDLLTDKDRTVDELTVSYHFDDPENGSIKRGGTPRNARFSDGMMEMQFFSPPVRGLYKLVVKVESGGKFVEVPIDAEVVFGANDDMTETLGNKIEQAIAEDRALGDGDLADLYVQETDREDLMSLNKDKLVSMVEELTGIINKQNEEINSVAKTVVDQQLTANRQEIDRKMDQMYLEMKKLEDILNE